MIVSKGAMAKEVGHLLLNLGQIIFTVVIVGAVFNGNDSSNLMISCGVMVLLCFVGIIFICGKKR